MTEVYFHYSNADGVLIDRSGIGLDDLAEVREHADGLINSLIMAPSVEDWRGWVLHVTDNNGNEIFEVPFATVLGRPH